MDRHIEMLTSIGFTDHHVHTVLGQGSEGTVYLIEDETRESKLVLKIFHESHTRDWCPGLISYAENINANDYGLPDVTLLYSGDEIIGAVYPYVELNMLHWRILSSVEKVAQSIVGSYAEKQYHLLSEYSLALCDPVLPHFMVDRQGQWHFMDIGASIRSLSDPKAHQNGLLGYRFASLIMGVHHVEIHHLMQPTGSYSYAEPCVYWGNEWLDAIAVKHEWVRDLQSEIRSNNATIFFDPEFYRRLSLCLPHRIPLPSLILPASKTLTWLGKVRGRKVNLGRTYSE